MAYAYIKAIHIIFVVSWFAGLFYMPRLLIYHTEAAEKPEPEAGILKAQFVHMEKKLWQIIMTPAMILTLVSGMSMVAMAPGLLQQGWLQVKLCFVLALLFYHIRTGKLMHSMQGGKFSKTSFQLRLWNELATLILVAIVFLVVLKSAVNWVYGVLGLLLLGVLLMLAVRLYRRMRRRQRRQN